MITNSTSSDCNWTRTHNYLAHKRTLNHLAKLAKWLTVSLWTKWLWVRVQLQSLKLQTSHLLRTWHDKITQLIPLHLIKSAFGINFKFHLNLDFDDSKILTFLSFDKQLFRNWCKYLLSFVNIPCSILSQPIWYNKIIKIGSKPIYVEEFVKQNFFFLYDFFNSGNEFKTWDKLGKKYSKKIKAQI